MPRRILLLLLPLLAIAPLATAGTPIATLYVTGTSTSVLDFGAHTVGTPTTQSMGLQAAPGNAVGATPTAITLTAGDFTQTNSCVSTTVAPGGSCPLNGTFTPSAVGPATATLSVTCVTVGAGLVAVFAIACDGNPHAVTLTGTGLAAVIAAAVPATAPAMVAALATALLAWGILFLRRRQTSARRD